MFQLNYSFNIKYISRDVIPYFANSFSCLSKGSLPRERSTPLPWKPEHSLIFGRGRRLSLIEVGNSTRCHRRRLSSQQNVPYELISMSTLIALWGSEIDQTNVYVVFKRIYKPILIKTEGKKKYCYCLVLIHILYLPNDFRALYILLFPVQLSAEKLWKRTIS